MTSDMETEREVSQFTTNIIASFTNLVTTGGVDCMHRIVLRTYWWDRSESRFWRSMEPSPWKTCATHSAETDSRNAAAALLHQARQVCIQHNIPPGQKRFKKSHSHSLTRKGWLQSGMPGALITAGPCTQVTGWQHRPCQQRCLSPTSVSIW